jgi:DNA-binding beta-propeller fold protein YncE
VVSALATIPAPAQAEIGSELFRFGERGSGAGQLDTARNGGIAADPDSGHVFVTEFGNNRISEFTAWGEFVKAWGWGVRDGSPELQTCTTETGCRKGIAGSGAGQIVGPSGIALDPSGDVFVFETGGAAFAGEPAVDQRIQKFSTTGGFLWMAGGEVNKTSGADICTQADLEGGDVCEGGVPGSGPGEFSRTDVGGAGRRDMIDVGPDNRLYVADHKRIQSFDLDGVYQGELPFAPIHGSNPLFPAEKSPGGLAIDPTSEDLILAFTSIGHCCGPSSAWRISQAGAVLDPAPLFSTFPPPGVPAWTDAVAADSAGSAYFAIDPADTTPGQDYPREREPRVVQLDATGTQTGECCLSPPLPVGVHDNIFALAANTVTEAGSTALYVAHYVDWEKFPDEELIEVRGPAPDKWPPPAVPPTIAAQYAHTVGAESALLKAEINPNFWEDTSYRLEYGAAPCSEGGCETLAEHQLGAGIAKKNFATDGVPLTGLEPATTYHYRFRAQSGGGGPVFGPDRAFTTYALPKRPDSACPNATLRSGSSAALADCRAYELVSPIDKEGADISVHNQFNGYLARLDQAAPSGQKITYSASTAFGDAQGAPYSSQYLSSRTGEGWATSAISPSQDSGTIFTTNDLDSHFKAFSEDLSSGWLVNGSGPPLAPDALEGSGNLYRRQNHTGAYEAITTVKPPAAFYPVPLGFSADGSRSFFRAMGKLTPDAASSASIWQVYEAHQGQLRLISARPNGKAASSNSSIGVASVDERSRFDNLDTAVSDDGRLVYWTEEAGLTTNLYLRIEGAETIAVSGPGSATFWRASPDGRRMIYAEDGALRRFEYSTRESTTLVPGGTVGVMGASEDLSRIYFGSTEALAAGATADKPNLYLHEDGSPLRFVATLGDPEAPGLSGKGGAIPSLALNPLLHFARVTADGRVALFMSNRALTGAENLDRDAGKPVAEIFRYDAQGGELRCLSCLPTGARPKAIELKVSLSETSSYLYSAKIPGYEFQLHAPRALSEDGKRAFFDSVNRLTLADTNGRSDVYQWEAEGKGECEEGAPGHDPATGGCVTLISDGRGSSGAEFIDASADGADAFFFTGTSLLPQDSGQIDVYDARVGGGFPQPPAAAAQCEGEACQGPSAAPEDPTPASAAYRGAGNAIQAPRRARRCPKGKARRKGRCVKGKRGRGAKRAKRHRHHRRKHRKQAKTKAGGRR